MKRTGAGTGDNMLAQMMRSSRIWILMLFFGTQAMLFYCMTAWGPTITQSKGFTLEQSSAAATFLQVVGIPITFLGPILAKKFTARRILTILSVSYFAGGILFYFVEDPVLVYISLFLYAQGMGSTFSFAFLFFAQMGRSPGETALISGIVQSGGYVLAAVGPVLMGALADITGAWHYPVIFLIITIVIACTAGVISSKEGTVLS